MFELKLKYPARGITTVIYILVLAILSCRSIRNDKPDSIIPFIVPEGWPKTVYNFTQNPITEAGFQLGRALFYDPVLSADSSTSCASCHLQATAFTHSDHAISHGIGGRIGTRNSLALSNLAWNNTFMWDGGVHNIEFQALAPITNPDEMDSDLQKVVEKLNKKPFYQVVAKRAFKDSVLTGAKTLKAIAQFVLSLNSFTSKYDKVMRKEVGIAFTEQEANGLLIFRQHCNSCHNEPLFTNNQFKSNGLAIDPELKDYGRIKITKKPLDSLKFKVPTLRNIEFSGPYMHDGRLASLKEVIKHYTTGIKQSPTLSMELQTKINLTSNQKLDLMAFLLTLTDREFLFNPRFSNPFPAQ